MTGRIGNGVLQATKGLAQIQRFCAYSRGPDTSIQPTQCGLKFLRSPFEDWPKRTVFGKERLVGDWPPKGLVKRVLGSMTKGCGLSLWWPSLCSIVKLLYMLRHGVGLTKKFWQLSEWKRLHQTPMLMIRWKNMSALRSAGKRTLPMGKIAALQGWYSVASLDPGSQLVLTGAELEPWYQGAITSLQ